MKVKNSISDIDLCLRMALGKFTSGKYSGIKHFVMSHVLVFNHAVKTKNLFEVFLQTRGINDVSGRT